MRKLIIILLCSSCAIVPKSPIDVSTVCQVLVEDNNDVLLGGGTGSCIYQDAAYLYILTARHVVNDAPEGSKIKLRTWLYDDMGRSCSESTISAHVIYISPVFDFAILRAEKTIKMGTLKLKQSECCVGDKVTCISCPNMIMPIVNYGNIARFALVNDYFKMTFDIITCDIMPGSSGGPFLLYGTNEIVGIVSIGYGDRNTYICGAVSSIDIIKDLKQSKWAFILGDL